MNKPTFLSLFLLLGIGSATYFVKQRVHRLEVKLAHVQMNISCLEEGIHILYAENHYLSRPERLQDLAENKLGLVCAHAYQMIDDHNFAADKKTKFLHLVSMR